MCGPGIRFFRAPNFLKLFRAVCVCVCMYMSVRLHVCAYMSVRLHVCAYMSVCLHVCAYMSACLHVCAYMSAFAAHHKLRSFWSCMCMYICMFISVCLHVHACLYPAHQRLRSAMYINMYRCLYTCTGPPTSENTCTDKYIYAYTDAPVYPRSNRVRQDTHTHTQ
jgi:hypothetical protein